MKKFKPSDFSFIYNKKEEEYVYLKADKVFYKLVYINYAQGIPYEWFLFKVVHKIDGGTCDELVYSGKIPTFNFAVELFQNSLNENCFL